ncbi:hypothetical protein [Bythopirellula polymerisocia]|uniref:Uncharacterized protein n=1 Tax=Bythopirellula polymerisocia TaxID=2528003 RepID=A0A5C6CRF7_9BACT|nr:hypothetical protein [Bythopirellula polymerisocia]TWU26117.1 hypothetical protein Pla144_33340 [Bythopirellula polymerisocia]
MVTGLVFLLVSGMAVVCGWQPMPDGSASYECVIQLEPELVSTLKGGDSIPLSVDVPDHVRPIKRVRIVVGSGSVPQQNLVTNLKPWPDDDSKESREGIVEAQYTYPNNTGDNRYASQPAVTQPVLPPSENPLSSQEAFARSLQNGGQAVREAATQATQDILPPDPGRSISDAVDRTGQQMSSQVRNVGETVNSNIRQLFGGEPAGGIAQGSTSQDSQILPPGSTPTADSNVRSGLADNGQTILPPGGTQLQNNRSTAQPSGVSPGGDWQSRTSAAPNPTSSDSRRMTNNAVPGVDSSRLGNQNFSAGQGATGNSSPGGSAPAFNSRNSSVIPQGQRYPDSIPAPERDSFDLADNRSRTPASDEPKESGLSFPDFTPTVSSDSGSARPATQPLQGQSSVPEIRRNMLNVPADAELRGANGLPIAQQNPNSTPPAGSQATTPPTNFDWNTQAEPQSQSPQPVVQAGANPAPMFPLLLSWVLLSGSGAGNLYLFWSYLDIRNKYRDVLYDASRKISGRHGRDS